MPFDPSPSPIPMKWCACRYADVPAHDCPSWISGHYMKCDQQIPECEDEG